MTEPERELTADQVVLLYEGQLNRTILLHLAAGFAAAIAGLAVAYLLNWSTWGIVALFAAILLGGMLQRLIVLRVRCPRCGARALGRIHSIVQVRSIRECPRCGARLRD